MYQLHLNDESMNICKKRKDSLSDAMKTVHEFYLKPSILVEHPGKTVKKGNYMYYNTGSRIHTNSSKNNLVTPSGFLSLHHSNQIMLRHPHTACAFIALKLRTS